MATLTAAEIAASQYFDEEQYIQSKARIMVLNGKAPDVATAVAQFQSKWTGDMIDHYLNYGANENVNPSNSFDNSDYILLVAVDEGREWAEVRAELNASGMSPLRDFLERGQGLGYDAPAIRPNDCCTDVGLISAFDTNSLTNQGSVVSNSQILIEVGDSNQPAEVTIAGQPAALDAAFGDFLI